TGARATPSTANAKPTQRYNRLIHKDMLDRSIQELESGSLARIASADTAEELETIRVELLGRKGGALVEIRKGMGKLAAEERARIGKLLNGAKQKLEGALDARLQEFSAVSLERKLDAEWVDLTLPAPGPRRGHLHPITRIQQEIE